LAKITRLKPKVVAEFAFTEWTRKDYCDTRATWISCRMFVELQRRLSSRMHTDSKRGGSGAAGGSGMFGSTGSGRTSTVSKRGAAVSFRFATTRHTKRPLAVAFFAWTRKPSDPRSLTCRSKSR